MLRTFQMTLIERRNSILSQLGIEPGHEVIKLFIILNSTQNETKLGQDLIPISGDVSDETEFMIRCNSSIERIKLYHQKVENHTEKLAEAVGDSDEELIKQIVSENEVICDQAMECVTHLKMFKEKN